MSTRHTGRTILVVAGPLVCAGLAGCGASGGSVGEIPADPPPVLVGRVHSVEDWGLRLQAGPGKPQTLGWADGADVFRQRLGAPADLRAGDCVSVDFTGPMPQDRAEVSVSSLYVLGRTVGGEALGAPAKDCARTMRNASAPGRIAGNLTGTGPGEPLVLTGLAAVPHRAGQQQTSTPSESVGGLPSVLPERLTLRQVDSGTIWITARVDRADVAVAGCATAALTRQYGLPAVARITLHPEALGVCGRVTDDSAVLVPISVWATTSATATGPTTIPSRRPAPTVTP